MGIIHANNGKLVEAAKSYGESLEIKYKLNDPFGILVTLVNLGNVNRRRGSYKQALNNFTEALKLAEEVGNEEYMLITLKIGALK